MSDGYVVIDGKKVEGRRLSFDGDNLSVSSASPVDDEAISQMANAGDTMSSWVSDESDVVGDDSNSNEFVDDITAGHCFETPYGKIYVKSTEPVDVSLLGRTKDFVKKNAVPFGVGLAVGALCVGLLSIFGSKDKD